MQTDIRYFPHLYRDSVALMRLSADLAARPGVDQASLLMGTPANMDLLVDSGLVDAPPPAAPGDIVFVARGEPDALAAAYEAAGQALTQGESRSGEEGGEGADVPASLLDAVRAAAESSGAEASGGDFGNASEDAGEARLALISTPGEFAGAEALKALRAGLHALIFSDNVPLEQEKDLKREARERHLLVMGPDCGTAIVGGVPLAFANVVRRGDIGVVGASGTGIQQITCLIDRLGGGVSHALGTGSRDVSAEVGGLSMLAGLDALAADPGTRVIVLAAKPPAPEVARRVLDAARTCGKPVVVSFLGADEPLSGDALYGAATLEEAAHRAVALAAGRPADFVGAGPDDPDLRLRAAAAARFLPAERRFLRGLYTGGTFCYEAQVLLQNLLEPLYSNTPFGRAKPLESAWKSRAHTLLDLGDDEFTRGRPHPMIDPAPRNARVVEEAADPETGVILLDVVLGYGSNPDPAGELARAVASARAAAADARVRPPVFVASVCGTEADPQRFSEQCAVLEREDVRLCESNAQAVMLALLILRQAAARPHAVGGPS